MSAVCYNNNILFLRGVKTIVYALRQISLFHKIDEGEAACWPRRETMAFCLYFVVPCYNDADVLPLSVPVFLKKLADLTERNVVSGDSTLVLLNDGSSDTTWETIVSLRKGEERIVGINLAFNSGEQNALLAGLTYAAPRCDCVITMDSDLQDDINAVDRMLEEFLAGSDIVLGVRSRREDDPLFERLSTGIFYRLMEAAGTGQIREHANYRLLSRKAAGQLLAHTETHYYLPCVVSNMGLKRAMVYHERFARAAGASGYTVLKKLRLALDAVMIHSRLPLKLITAAAAVCAFLFLAAAVFAIAASVRSHTFDASAWGICATLLVGALALGALRVVAGYLSMIFDETRRAPRWQIDEILE